MTISPEHAVRRRTDRLYLLPFDHRGSFQSDLFGIEDHDPLEPTIHARISSLKMLIYEAVELAVCDGLDPADVGVLVDEEFGADVAKRAHDMGVTLAMPVEKSGQDEFDFEYGDEFDRHIVDFDPDLVKVLVRWNPEDHADLNERQGSKLRELSVWLKQNGRRFLFELLVPPTKSQLAAVDGDERRFEAESIPDLIVRAMAQIQAAGITVDVWKIQGVETREQCARIVAQARRGVLGSAVRCIVLGHGADDQQVARWIDAAAGVDGYVGFAVGRTLWQAPLESYLAGDLTADETKTRIAQSFIELVSRYEDAAATRDAP